MTRAAGIAQRYVEAMNTADIESMMALFATDAVVRHPTGIYSGSDAVRGFFLETAFAYSAHLDLIVAREEGDLAWLEVEARSDVTPGRQRVVDVFRLDAQGHILDLGVYSGNLVPGSEE
ncbi:MAG: nuclear transport factor 2 family protein [Deltaproteobacteria bacterium]|nr:nuclear transport factor 2 family protein [Deltaproteobacteria bacterium]MBW2499097.1 nuclear transport factor 2 family protein [Deltaproteobacteria bacterium]